MLIYKTAWKESIANHNKNHKLVCNELNTSLLTSTVLSNFFLITLIISTLYGFCLWLSRDTFQAVYNEHYHFFKCLVQYNIWSEGKRVSLPQSWSTKEALLINHRFYGIPLSVTSMASVYICANLLGVPRCCDCTSYVTPHCYNQVTIIQLYPKAKL